MSQTNNPSGADVLAMLACPTDREIIALATAVFADQPRQSESRRDNDLFYIRAIKALIDSQAEARTAVAALIARNEELGRSLHNVTTHRDTLRSQWNDLIEEAANAIGCEPKKQAVLGYIDALAAEKKALKVETGIPVSEKYLNDVQCLDIVVAVGERVGMHAPGWDMVSPIELCRAFDTELTLARTPAKENEA